MSAPRHTPGPWRVHGFRCIEAGDNDIIAVVETRKDLDEQRATQRLIAAAPELYDALRGLVASIERAAAAGIDLSGHLGVGAALAAIAKAEGRP